MVAQGEVRPGAVPDYRAVVVEDSIWQGNRLTSVEATYPLFVHQDLLTHRCFSRNASSNRALPIKKVIARVIDHPAYPVWWGRNQKGMTAEQELTGWRLWVAKQVWFKARYLAVLVALILYWLGLHKQLVNRLLAPWQWITTIFTATEWDNFYALRRHPDAQPEVQHIAKLMSRAMFASIPVERRWHLPYVTAEERASWSLFDCVRVSIARCASISYLRQYVLQSKVKALRLYDDLCVATPQHSSPMEHAARGTEFPDDGGYNLDGWHSWRYIADNDYLNITTDDLDRKVA